MTRQVQWRSAAITAALLLVRAAVVCAQGWVVEASAGAADYEAVAGAAGSAHAIVGIHRDAPTWVTLATGIPLDSAGVPWLAGGVGGRWSRPLRGVQVGVDGSVLGFGYRSSTFDGSGGGATAIALPFVALAVPRGTLEIRTGVLHHTSVFSGSRTWRTLLETGARGTLLLPRGLGAVAEARLLRGPEATYPWAGGTLYYGRGPMTAWASAGRWMADSLNVGGWGIGARLTLPGRLALRAAYERQPQDPLYWNGARTGWTIGLGRAFGARVAHERPPPHPAAFRTAAGEVVLSVPVAEAGGALSVAGDFTGWEPVAMKQRNGAWEARFELAPGVYHFAFRREDGSWFLPDSVQNRVDDGFGGMNGVLVVVAP